LNANENDIQNMKAIIPSITISSIDKQDNSIIVSLEYSNSVDPRKDVFNYCVEKEWVLLEMRASKRNLEDIFRSLTGKGDSAHA